MIENNNIFPSPARRRWPQDLIAVVILLSLFLAGCQPTATPSVTRSVAPTTVPSKWTALLPVPTPTGQHTFPRIGKTLHALSPNVHLVAFAKLKSKGSDVEDLLLLYQDGQYAGASGRGLIVPVDESTPAIFLGGAGATTLFDADWEGLRITDLAGDGQPLLLLFGKMRDSSTLLTAFQAQKPYLFQFQIRVDDTVRWDGKTPATLAGQWQISPALRQETRVHWDGSHWQTAQHIQLSQTTHTNAADIVAWHFWQAVTNHDQTKMRFYAIPSTLTATQPYLQRDHLQLWRLLPRLNDGKTAVYWVDLRWRHNKTPCWEQSATLVLKYNQRAWRVTDLEPGSQRCSRQPQPPRDQ